MTKKTLKRFEFEESKLKGGGGSVYMKHDVCVKLECVCVRVCVFYHLHPAECVQAAALIPTGRVNRRRATLTLTRGSNSS